MHGMSLPEPLQRPSKEASRGEKTEVQKEEGIISTQGLVRCG